MRFTLNITESLLVKPTIGRIVTVLGLASNGAHEHPAVITRVWAPDVDTIDKPVLVNLTVFPDGDQPQTHGAVELCDTRQIAVSVQGANRGKVVAHWPARDGQDAPAPH